ncbi:MAG: VIT1/CCC1 transporter family protein [Actinomycetota bacterium]
MATSTKDPQAARFFELWADELAGAALYRALAERASDQRRGILLELAQAEERHAEHWAKLMAERGLTNPKRPPLPLRVRALSFLARRFGSDTVLPMVLRLEAADASKYDSIAEAPDSMAAQERAHGKTVSALVGGTTGTRIARAEGRHRVGAAGALRAGVFGFNDGLVSNLSIVMGVAGGTTNNGKFVLLAGVAGLVAGAFSMATGEWISVRSQRELYEREIGLEADELAHFPEEEQEELALIFRAKGVEKEEAEALAQRLMSRPDTALDTLVREELGIDPSELVSPWTAAGSSFITFALGAFVPVIPFIVGSGTAALWTAAGLAAVMLLGVGAAISVFTGRPAIRNGVRMLVIGALAAGATYVVGKLVGVNVS